MYPTINTQEDHFPFQPKKAYGFYLFVTEIPVPLGKLNSAERHKEVIILHCVLWIMRANSDPSFSSKSLLFSVNLLKVYFGQSKTVLSLMWDKKEKTLTLINIAKTTQE